jgi:hypothetical protein
MCFIAPLPASLFSAFGFDNPDLAGNFPKVKHEPELADAVYQSGRGFTQRNTPRTASAVPAH